LRIGDHFAVTLAGLRVNLADAESKISQIDTASPGRLVNLGLPVLRLER
jgi:hypothetical protein